jgi:hypothetical protein
MICWDKRLTRQRARAAGECYCLTFWNEVTHDLGVCGCECPDCQLKQEVFKEADDKLWHAALLKGFEEKASEPELPFPEDHVDPWCECETCAPIVRHNAAIENARWAWPASGSGSVSKRSGSTPLGCSRPRASRLRPGRRPKRKPGRLNGSRLPWWRRSGSSRSA